MSEVTSREEETTEFDTVNSTRPRSGLRRVLDTRLGRLAVLGAVLVVVLSALAWWAAMGADRSTGGRALPAANVVVDIRWRNTWCTGTA